MIYNVNTAAWLCRVGQGIESLFVDGDLDVSALGPVSFKHKLTSCVPRFLDLLPHFECCFYFEISLAWVGLHLTLSSASYVRELQVHAHIHLDLCPADLFPPFFSAPFNPRTQMQRQEDL